ncbi:MULTISPECIES: very short patch repair endonuclease [unclassified Herbaspirillum]|nr:MULTISPECIES: very short patch repair endonuclease [unclassified Herbaspirillum]
MAGIRSKNTKPEMVVRKFLHSKGFRYRLHSAKLPGKPDLALSKYRTVIFVHGCFWHQHEGCARAYRPSTRKEIWELKFASNKARDKKVLDALKELGWNSIVIWECGLVNSDPDIALKWLPYEIEHPKSYLFEWPDTPPYQT